jgi:NAD(P)H-flavin reductase
MVVFIGTGTGFAPLYFQAKHLLDTAPMTSIRFIFGVREEKDLFYGEKLSEWTTKYPHFSYQFCLSQ